MFSCSLAIKEWRFIVPGRHIHKEQKPQKYQTVRLVCLAGMRCEFLRILFGQMARPTHNYVGSSGRNVITSS